MSFTYRELYDLIEEAIFQYQAKNTFEVIRHVRRDNRNVSVDKNEIDRLIHKVATSYKAEQ